MVYVQLLSLQYKYVETAYHRNVSRPRISHLARDDKQTKMRLDRMFTKQHRASHPDSSIGLEKVEATRSRWVVVVRIPKFRIGIEFFILNIIWYIIWRKFPFR